MSTSFTTLHVTHTNRVVHAVIDAPPINLIGPELISDFEALCDFRSTERRQTRHRRCIGRGAIFSNAHSE